MSQNVQSVENQSNQNREEAYRLSQSPLWKIQRQFFEQQGIAAWKNGAVPHYITSNPFIAHFFRDLVGGFLRDGLTSQQQPKNRRLKSHQPGFDPSHPIYILELGAGSGRFAFRFLKAFFSGYINSVALGITVKYVMTDLAAENLNFWQSHPMLQSFITQGLLDFAQLDCDRRTTLQLLGSQEILSPQTLKNPLIVIANYCFDSIPQDLFTLKDGQLHETLVSLTEPDMIADLSPAARLKQLELSYSDRPTKPDYYKNPAFNQVLQYYQQQLTDTSFLFPISAFNTLEYLRELSGDRLLLLSADKGYCHQSELAGRGKPKLNLHGSFSLMVNYHAIAQYVQNQGGLALGPSHHSHSLGICAFLFGQSSATYQQLQNAYQLGIQNSNPDDFFTLKKTLEPHYPEFSLSQLLAYLRFSGWDSNIFLGCWSTLMLLATDATEPQRQDLHRAIERIWEQYFWIGESTDLPLQISRLLIKLGNPDAAINYLNYSLKFQGEQPEQLLYWAICHLHLGHSAKALEILERATTLNPKLESAQALKQVLEANDLDLESDHLGELIEEIMRSPRSFTRDNLASETNVQNSSDGNISWQQANYRFLIAAVAVVRYHLERIIAYRESAKWDDKKLEVLLSKLEAAKAAMPSAPALERLYNLFYLEPFEIDLLLLCVGMELDPAFPKLCADAQGDASLNYPTFALAIEALPGLDWEAISSSGRLRYWRMIEMQAGPTMLTCPLIVDENIFLFLMGQPYLDKRLAGIIEPLTTEDRLAPSHLELVQQLEATWVEAAHQEQAPVFQLCGDDRAAKRAIAAAAAEKLGMRLSLVSIHALPTSPSERSNLLRLWDREALLFDHGYYIECDRLEESETERSESLHYLLENSVSFTIVSSAERGLQTIRNMLTYDVEKPTLVEQRQFWEHLFSSEFDLDHNRLVNQLVFQFHMTYPTIEATWLAALGQLGETEQFTDKELAETLWSTCRIQARPKLDDMVQRIEPKACWEDLVLPESQKQVIEEIAVEVRQRATVYESWGLGGQSSRGLGISALFAGSSGTGKTLAAEVLAKELRLDLYRIDLSTVIDKYIGETEKKLRRVFDAAEAGGAILLFDEADALFGKRSESKDSHDRYANIQVSYLLQQMEAYRGLAILTSNIPEALDNAFKRRLSFIVHFPFPEPSQRAQIWQRMFPPQMPQEGLDFQKLGLLHVAGGNIRSIARKAAFMAAESGDAVTMSYLLQAARSEYRKLEKSLTTEEIRGWE